MQDFGTVPQRLEIAHVVEAVDRFTETGIHENGRFESVGSFGVSLRVYPCGTSKSKDHLAAFVLIVPDVWCSKEWSLPDVEVSITAINADPKKSITKITTHTFNSDIPGIGWHDFVKGQSWAAMRDSGWVSKDNTLQLKAVVKGNFYIEQPVQPKVSAGGSLWMSKKFCDVVVATEAGAEIPSHCNVLASASPVFERMLLCEMSEASQKRIVIRGVSEHVLRTFLLFLYFDALPDVADYAALLRLADMYGISKLANTCSKRMCSRLSAASVLDDFGTLSMHKRALGEQSMSCFAERVTKCPRMEAVLTDHLLDKEFVQRKIIAQVKSDRELKKRLVAPLLKADLLFDT
eukprot:TRINITY_DN47136_c0_g1_i1.p1 TRINITY_DN47136_c0_g1~~TRINITY_DN47136_c0_g1_i1.p1  ORF type:complete len:348 (+),score=46.76 TRINITY_DN47136_c0_g1_i1:46-1089(+)